MKSGNSEFSNRYQKMLKQAISAAAITAVSMFVAGASAEEQDRKQIQVAQADRSTSSQTTSTRQTSFEAPSFWTRYDDQRDFDRH